jgi:two-component system nitrate/nitrite response regulator NarL
MPEMRVLLCDDHLLFLEVMRPVLEARGHTVDLTTSVDEAIACVRERHPDIVVLDVGFPSGSGIDGVRPIIELDSEVKVVVLTGLADPSVARDAIAAGVVGIAYKGRPLGETVQMLERVLHGETVIDGHAPRHPVEPDTPSEQQWLAGFLTPREKEVLARLVHGEGTIRIAAAMGVSQSTARTHIQSVLTKLGVHSRVEACSFAVRHHIVDVPPTGED